MESVSKNPKGVDPVVKDELPGQIGLFVL